MRIRAVEAILLQAIFLGAITLFLMSCGPQGSLLQQERAAGLEMLTVAEFEEVYQGNYRRADARAIPDDQFEQELVIHKKSQKKQLMLLLTNDYCENCVELRDTLVEFRDKHSNPEMIMVRELNMDGSGSEVKALIEKLSLNKYPNMNSEVGKIYLTYSSLKKVDRADGTLWRSAAGLMGVQPVHGNVWIQKNNADHWEGNITELVTWLSSSENRPAILKKGFPNLDKNIDMKAFLGEGLISYRKRLPKKDPEPAASSASGELEEGQLVFVKIGATWCGPCRLMANDIRANKAMLDQAGVVIESYDTDVPRENTELHRIGLGGIGTYPSWGLFLKKDGVYRMIDGLYTGTKSAAGIQRLYLAGKARLKKNEN